MSVNKATLNYPLPNPSTNVPAFDVYTAALSIDPQNVIPTNTHCDNCFNDATSEMKLFSCQHSVCQKCLETFANANNLYAPLFGQNQACPICCIDTKPMIPSHHFIPNGNSLPPPNGGYIPMNVFPPPEHKPMNMDPFTSLMYHQPPPLPMPHMNGSHINPFQGYNGTHSGMKIHPNTGPPLCSPNLSTTINNAFPNPIHPQMPEPSNHESGNVTPNSPLPLPPPPPPFNVNHTPTLPNTLPPHLPHNLALQDPIQNSLPLLPPNNLDAIQNHMPILPNNLPTTIAIQNPIPHLPSSLPTSDAIQNTLPPHLPNNLPSADSIQNSLPTLPKNLPTQDPIQNTLPTTSLPSTTLPSSLQSILPSSSTSTSLTSSEASSGSSVTNANIVQLPVLCSSCDEALTAIAQCTDCDDYLCESCYKAHRKVRITREHKIINITTKELLDSSQTTSPSTNSCSPSSNKSTCSVTSPNGYPTSRYKSLMTIDDQVDGIETHGDCSKHDGDRLIYFCQTCGILLCKTCLVSDHTHHNYGYIREMYDRFKPAIEELVSKTKVQVLLLENSIKSITKLSESVEQKSSESLKKIQETVVQYTKALTEYEEELREKVKRITEKRVESLKEQKSSLEGALGSLKAISLTSEKALKEQNKGEVLSSRIHLVANLRDKNSTEFPRNPTEDDTYIVKTSSSSVEKVLASLVRVTTAPYAPLCTAEGDGLKRPKINKSCNIVVTTKDRNGDPCIECKEKLFVQMKSGDGHNVPVEVNTDDEGVYTLNFKPRVAGEHQLIIAIRGQHIEGSPFILPIDGGRDYAKISSSIPFSFGSEGAEEGMFCRPWGICTNSEGDLIIGDRSNHRVQIFTSSGTFKSQFGTEGTRQGQFCRPAGVATTKEDNIVVADKDNHRVQVFKSDANFLFTFGSKGSNDNQMIYPYDVTVTPDNEKIVVSDSGNHRLLIFNTLGVLLAKFGYKGYLCGNFDSPRGVTVNDEGHIILTDFNVHHILVIHPNGRTAQIIGGQGSGNGQLMRPQGLAVDSMGNVVVADTRNHRIIVFHPNGHFVAKYGSHGQGPGEFDRPTAVTVLPDGKFAVVDFGNSRIQIF